MNLFLLCGMACKTEKAGETERERDSRCLRRYSLVFLILLKIHDYKTKKGIANVLLLSWAAVPYHNDISLTFVASSPINIACMVGCNINTKRSVSFDDKQRPGLASHAYLLLKRDRRLWDKKGLRLFLSLPVSS